MSSDLGNAPLIPNRFGLSPEQVRALVGTPLVEIAQYHEAMAATASNAATKARMPAGKGLHAQAEKHNRWAKHLRELIANQGGRSC